MNDTEQRDQIVRKARIFCPVKSAMQSGMAHSHHWILEFEPVAERTQNALMGWTSSSDMDQELLLKFNTKEEAVAYATRNHIQYELIQPHTRRITPKSYAENFK